MSLIKLLWADHAWYDLTFMKYYWINNPSPNPLAWYLYQLPMSLQKVITLLSLLLELSIPLSMLLGRKGRIFAFFVSFFISLFIQLTGNFGFFNVLTIVIGLWCLDDVFLKRIPVLKLQKPNNISKIGRMNVKLFFVMISISLIFNLFYLKEYFNPKFHKSYSGFANYSLLKTPYSNNISSPLFYIHGIIRLFSNFKIVSPHGVFKGIPQQRLHLDFFVQANNKKWTKIPPIKGKEITIFSFSSPNMNRLQFNYVYKAYGIDFKLCYTDLYPNLKYLPIWTQNLPKAILTKSNSDVKKLVDIPNRNNVTLKIEQTLYVPSVNAKWEQQIKMDSLIITKDNLQNIPPSLFDLGKTFKKINLINSLDAK